MSLKTMQSFYNFMKMKIHIIEGDNLVSGYSNNLIMT